MATKSQVNIFRELADIWMKIIITVILVICYVGVLIFIGYLIISKTPLENIALVSVFEVILTLCIPQLMKHYLPSREK